MCYNISESCDNMNNPYKNSDSNLRYYSFNYYTKQTFNSKISKISLNAGLTCPNRDGHISYGGCTFCSSHGSGDFAGVPTDSLLKQYADNKAMMHRKWPDSKTIAYFQAYTNTYTSLDNLKRMIEPFLEIDEIVAIDIATRPDCLSDEILSYLEEVNKKKTIWLELGLQTCSDSIADSFNRGYPYSVFLDTIERVKKTKLKVCVHLINGLPNETKEMMIENAQKVSDLKVDSIKIHMLHLVSDSVMGQQYLKEPFHLLSRKEYVDIVASQLEIIHEDIIMERLTGDADFETLIEPLWTKKKVIVLNEIQKELVRRDTYQGIYNKKKRR